MKRTLFGFVCLALVLMLQPGLSGAAVLEKGKAYEGGDIVEAPEAGVGFIVPLGWRGAYQETLDMFVMSPDGVSFIFAFARKEMDKEQLLELFSKPIKLINGIDMQPTDKPFISYQEISVPYMVEKSGEPMAGFGRGRIGPDGRAIAFIAAGPAMRGSSLAVVTRRLSRTARFFGPVNQDIQ